MVRHYFSCCYQLEIRHTCDLDFCYITLYIVLDIIRSYYYLLEMHRTLLNYKYNFLREIHSFKEANFFLGKTANLKKNQICKEVFILNPIDFISSRK